MGMGCTREPWRETYRETDALCRPKVKSLPSPQTAVLSLDPRTAGN